MCSTMPMVMPWLVDFPHQVDHLQGLVAVQPGHDLIQKQELGLRGQGAGDLHLFDFQGGHPADVPAEVGEPQEPAQLLRLPPGFLFGQPLPEERPHHDVLHQAEPRQGTNQLKGPPDAQAASPVGRHFAHIPIFKKDFSLRGKVDAGDDVDEGRLPRPVRADDPQDLVFPELDADPGQGGQPAEMSGSTFRSLKSPWEVPSNDCPSFSFLVPRFPRSPAGKTGWPRR